MMNIVRYFIPILIFLVCFACENETKNTQERIQGKWELYAAERDGSNAPTLEGTYFHFMGDTMVSNFPTIPKIPYTVPIKVTANTINNLDQDVVFNVEPNDYQDTLHLSITFRSMNFDLKLKRVE